MLYGGCWTRGYRAAMTACNPGHNLALADAHQGPRIAWRISELCAGHVVEMTGKNLRA